MWQGLAIYYSQELAAREEQGREGDDNRLEEQLDLSSESDDEYETQGSESDSSYSSSTSENSDADSDASSLTSVRTPINKKGP